jgi:hypothetical protein
VHHRTPELEQNRLRDMSFDLGVHEFGHKLSKLISRNDNGGSMFGAALGQDWSKTFFYQLACTHYFACHDLKYILSSVQKQRPSVQNF